MKLITLSILFLFSITIHAQVEEFVLGGQTDLDWAKGSFVDVEGDVAVAGVPFGQVGRFSNGFVYVYEFNGEQWKLEGKLTGAEDSFGDQFGGDVEVSQGRIIVGAEQADRVVDGVPVFHSGQVYIFEKVDGEWIQTAELVPSIVDEEDHFGAKIVASSNRIFVSKGDFDSSEDESAGGVFVFEYINGDWIETDLITENEVLGGFTTLGYWRMSVSGDTLVVPSNYFGNGLTSDVYIYRLNNNKWQFEQKIISPTGYSDDFFGNSVSIYGDQLLIGASNENSSNGGVYLFERINNVWSQSHKFESSNTGETPFFGISVAMGDNQLVISSRHQLVDSTGLDEGQAFIYNFNGESWELAETLEADGNQGHNHFGESIALDHDRLLVGAPNSGRRSSGAAYAYTIEPNSERLPINAGLNGTWYNPETSGQGLFLDISNALDFSFMGLFTYDVEMSSNDLSGQIGAEGQRWLVGAGEVNPSSSSINYSLYYTYDGLFDDPREVVVAETETYGSLIIEFQSCTRALVTYYLFESGISGSYPINRPVAESGELCAELAAENAAQIPSTDEFDYSLNGAWFNPDTSGQGFFIDKFKGVDTAFMGWFTYDTELPTSEDSSTVGALGQRWLVGAGAVDVTDASVLNFELYYTYGGLFDDPTEVTVFEPGSYGDLRIEFIDCAHANVEYSIDSEDLFGSFSMVRAVPNGASCNEVVE